MLQMPIYAHTYLATRYMFPSALPDMPGMAVF